MKALSSTLNWVSVRSALFCFALDFKDMALVSVKAITLLLPIEKTRESELVLEVDKQR